MNQMLQIVNVPTFEKQSRNLEQATSSTLRFNDLNIFSLTYFGGLDVKWTLPAKDHLKLDLKEMTLWVMWCMLPHDESPAGQWCQDILNKRGDSFPGSIGSKVALTDVDEDIVRSWALLFNTSIYDRRQITKTYNSLQRPWWADRLNPLSQQKVHFGFAVSEDEDEDEDADVIYGRYRKHYRRYYRTMKNRVNGQSEIAYMHFPIYEARLRELRFYMDSRKLTTFWQLWSDNRDTLNYYTFWGVLIVGGVSILLAVLSLSVSIAQTIASFRALEPQTHN